MYSLFAWNWDLTGHPVFYMAALPTDEGTAGFSGKNHHVIKMCKTIQCWSGNLISSVYSCTNLL